VTQVRVEQGILEGDQEHGVFRFRGVPYAAPPIADLRWAAPQPPASWDGVRDATSFGNAAIQGLFHRAILPGQVHTPANLVWGPTEDGRIVAADLSCWRVDIPILFGHTANEARYFITPTGPYGAPPGLVDPARLYTPATLARMAAVFGRQHADAIVASLTGSPYEELAELFTAAVWTEPALASYRRFTELGRTTYAYRFERISPGNPRVDGVRPDRRAEQPRRHPLARRHQHSAAPDGHRRQDPELPADDRSGHRVAQLPAALAKRY